MTRVLIAIAMAIVLVCPVCSEQQTAATPCAIRDFFHGIVGEWVGTCRQTTNKERADDKYFHVVIRETDDGTFEATFEYYRVNDAGKLVRIGNSKVTTAISSSCTATTKITGSGEILVDKKPKKQEHALTECLTAMGEGCVEARGSGTLKVYGLPLGLGKLGKVSDDQSSWTVSNGTLAIHQNLSIAFRALCLSKSFTVNAEYTAVRGSDVSSQLPKQIPASTKFGG